MKRSVSLHGLYTMGIAALFLAGFLLLVTFGARTYRDAAEKQEENNRERALLSYIATCVKSSDAADGVALLEDETGLVLRIGSSEGYALYIYQKDGQLLEEYRAAGRSADPDNTTVLGETEVFMVERDENILRITTDAGELLLVLRSGEGRQ